MRSAPERCGAFEERALTNLFWRSEEGERFNLIDKRFYERGRDIGPSGEFSPPLGQYPILNG